MGTILIVIFTTISPQIGDSGNEKDPAITVWGGSSDSSEESINPRKPAEREKEKNSTATKGSSGSSEESINLRKPTAEKEQGGWAGRRQGEDCLEPEGAERDGCVRNLQTAN